MSLVRRDRGMALLKENESTSHVRRLGNSAVDGRSFIRGQNLNRDLPYGRSGRASFEVYFQLDLKPLSNLNGSVGFEKVPNLDPTQLLLEGADLSSIFAALQAQKPH